jgi:hypothetical protein
VGSDASQNANPCPALRNLNGLGAVFCPVLGAARRREGERRAGKLERRRGGCGGAQRVIFVELGITFSIGSTALRSPASRLRSTTRIALFSRNTCK